MSKARATTIQQRFGFNDGDLKTPTHDQLMLWLDENVERIINEIIPNEWTEKDIDWPNQELSKDNRLIKVAHLPDRTRLEIAEKIWESPIMSGKYVVGFVDMFIKYKADCIDLIRRDVMWCSGWRIEKSVWTVPVCFEVKAAIPSLGELIRQIRMYQEYQGGKYVVLSPDARFAEALRAQNINFYHYILDPFDAAMT